VFTLWIFRPDIEFVGGACRLLYGIRTFDVELVLQVGGNCRPDIHWDIFLFKRA